MLLRAHEVVVVGENRVRLGARGGSWRRREYRCREAVGGGRCLRRGDRKTSARMLLKGVAAAGPLSPGV